MAKYLIHTCNQRLWYVEEYLIPSMIEQGISENDITMYLDKNADGCLKSFVESAKRLPEDGGTWHLQDDVIICKDFKKRTEELDDGIICGFTCNYDKVPKPGWNIVKENMWWSFPCIRIPNDIIHKFHEWVDLWVWRDPQYGRYVRAKKYDDLIFKIFMESYYPNEKILNLAPNLVDHIDYLLGGSVINRQRAMRDVRSLFWEDEDLVEELTKRIKERKVIP